MTSNEAKKQGLVFTGYASDWDKNAMKLIAKDIRDKYQCRAVVTDDSKGLKVYVDNRYVLLKKYEYNRKKLQDIPKIRTKLKIQFEERIKDLNAEEQIIIDYMEKLKKELWSR